jgi:hypothetical protein
MVFLAQYLMHHCSILKHNNPSCTLCKTNLCFMARKCCRPRSSSSLLRCSAHVTRCSFCSIPSLLSPSSHRPNSSPPLYSRFCFCGAPSRHLCTFHHLNFPCVAVAHDHIHATPLRLRVSALLLLLLGVCLAQIDPCNHVPSGTSPTPTLASPPVSCT